MFDKTVKYKQTFFLGKQPLFTMGLCLSVYLSCPSVLMAQAVQEIPLSRENKSVQNEKLTDVRQEIARIQPEFESLVERKDLLTREKANLSERLVIITEKVRAAEDRIAELEEEIKTADMQEQALSIDLSTRKSETSKILAAMGRLSLSPATPLGAVEDEEKTVHTAIILRNMTEELKKRADLLVRDLNLLRKMREKLKLNRRELAQEQLSLDSDSERLKILLETRQTNIEKTDHQLLDTRKKLAQLSDQEKTISGLIDKIDQENKRTELEEKLHQQEMINQASRSVAQQETPDTSFKPPAAMVKSYNKDVSLFSESQYARLKGKLVRPVSGKIVYGYGKPDQTGRPSQGITIQSKAASIVTAPVNAKVLYAGKFNNQGNIVILNPAGKHYVTLSGLGIINVSHGQTVAMGEPIGRMAPGVGTRNLFIEFRNFKTIVNPMDWLSHTYRTQVASHR